MSLKMEDMPPGFAEEIEAERDRQLDAQALERPNVIARIAALTEERDEHQRVRASLAIDTVGLEQRIRQAESRAEAAEAEVETVKTERNKWKGRARTAEWRVVLMGKALGKADRVYDFFYQRGIPGSAEGVKALLREYLEARTALTPTAEQMAGNPLREAAEWAYRFMTKEGTQPDDGDQREAITEALGEALGGAVES